VLQIFCHGHLHSSSEPRVYERGVHLVADTFDLISVGRRLGFPDPGSAKSAPLLRIATSIEPGAAAPCQVGRAPRYTIEFKAKLPFPVPGSFQSLTPRPVSRSLPSGNPTDRQNCMSQFERLSPVLVLCALLVPPQGSLWASGFLFEECPELQSLQMRMLPP